MKKEILKDAFDYKGIYQVSNKGKISEVFKGKFYNN